MKRLTLLLATGLGLGWSPVAPGTVASVLGVVIAAAMAPLSWQRQTVVAVGLIAAAVPICGWAEDHFGRKDDGRIVADEYLTFPLCVIGLPWPQHPWLMGAAFLTARFFDIVKPPPAHQAQAAQGGMGIVLDDVIACLYALALNHAIFRGCLLVMERVG
jgi:phosphatidylglycerophosphatase A